MNLKSEPRVLIVEDQDVLRVLLFTLLRYQSLAVDTAASAAEALLKVSSCDYALMIVDLDMPHRESESFLRQFREQRPEATTFVLGVRDPNGQSMLDASTVSVVLNKPIELDTLADIVRETAPIIPLPPDPLPCPPAESDIRSRMDPDAPILN